LALDARFGVCEHDLVSRSWWLAAVMGCSSPAAPADPCTTAAAMPAGTVELGLGSAFESITDNETVDLQLGGQGLWMFVINLRTSGLDVLSADGGVYATTAEGSNIVSLFPGCHPERFDAGSGFDELSSAYLLPFDPTLEDAPDGKTFTITAEVVDVDGHQATDSHTVVAHQP
jgi:hypothetical protein